MYRTLLIDCRYLVTTAVLVSLLLILLSSCSSIPREGGEKSSLLIILKNRSYDRGQGAEELGTEMDRLYLVDEGGSRRRIAFNADELFLTAVSPGTYRIAGRSARGGTSLEDIASIEISPDSVVLYRQIFVDTESGFASGGGVDSDDRHYSVQTLTSYVGFHEWLGKEYVGFGPYRPKMYLSGRHFEVEIATKPQDARIFIDDEQWGRTPRTIELTEGKYLLELEKEGYESFKRILSVDEDLRIAPELEAVEEGAQRERLKESFDIMVYPVVPFSADGDNSYGDLFTGTIEVNLSAEENINIVSFPSDAAFRTEKPADGSVDGYLDFGPAEEAGVDLIVAGKYELRGESLFLQASLYEATSRRVKYADIYRSEAGFAVFEAVDTLSETFVEEVSRVLPEPGEPIIKKEKGMGSEMLFYEKSVYRRKMIDQRLEHGHLISVTAGMGGLDDSDDLDNNTRWGMSGGGDLSMYQLTYTHPLSRALSASVGGEVNTAEIYVESDTEDEQLKALNFYSLLLGPEFDFRSETSEIFFKTLLRVGYAPSIQVSLAQNYRIGPLWYSGLNLDTGYRYYFYRKAGQRPLFLSLGFMIDLVEFRIQEDWGVRYVPLHGKIYVGGGVGL